jgi:endoglucanase
VFRAAPPGARISPNLAGRVAAAFALGAQVEAASDRRRARALLRAAASVFAMARTTGVGELVTAYPHAYYPEDSWQDDMEFGAVELALAARRLHDRREAGWLRAATHWARRYLGSEHRDALNLYDTSALAHADLVRALRRSRPGSGFEVSVDDLVADCDASWSPAPARPGRSPSARRWTWPSSTARFLDDVRAWPSVEPAIDFTSTGMLAFALAGTTGD